MRYFELRMIPSSLACMKAKAQYDTAQHSTARHSTSLGYAAELSRAECELSFICGNSSSHTCGMFYLALRMIPVVTRWYIRERNHGTAARRSVAQDRAEQQDTTLHGITRRCPALIDSADLRFAAGLVLHWWASAELYC